MNCCKVFKTYLFFTLISIFCMPLFATVGPIIPGQPLWCVTQRIGVTVDIIESKVCALDVEVSLLGETLISELDVIESKLDSFVGCASIPITSADIVGGVITLDTSGSYCLAEDVTATFTITANCVSLDLNNRCVTGTMFIDSDDVEVFNGNITPAAPTSAPAAGLTVAASSDRATVSDVTITCADTTADGIDGRTGMELHGNDTQILGCTIKSGAGEGTGTTGSNGGNGITIGSNANNVIIKRCIVSTGSGGAGSTTGGNGGHGISVEGDATESEITDTTILFTGSGGSSDTTNGNGGNGFNVESTALDTVIRNCTIRNTGAAGGMGSGTDGYAILDAVVIVANLTMSYSNFAHNIANSVKYALQGFTTEQGIALSNPPTTTLVNPFANVFAS